jgi:hypothetical protein
MPDPAKLFNHSRYPPAIVAAVIIGTEVDA